MEPSLFLARLIGLMSILMGLSMLLRRKMLMNVFHELAKSAAISYILGTLLVVMGLILILMHNIWNVGYQLVITLFGWLLLLEGSIYLFASTRLIKKYIAGLDNKKMYYFIGVAYVLVGAYLAYVGFGI